MVGGHRFYTSCINFILVFTIEVILPLCLFTAGLEAVSREYSLTLKWEVSLTSCLHLTKQVNWLFIQHQVSR